MKKGIVFIGFVIAILLSANSPFEAQNASEFVTLTVQKIGNGSGVVISSPPGIDCGDGFNDCTATFRRGTPVTLRARSLHGPSEFHGWSLALGSTQQCPGSRSDCSTILLVNSSARAEFVLD